MLKYSEPNPLTVFGLRELDYCPPHFTTLDFELKTTDKNISDWIWSNLSGRFWYSDYYYKNSEGVLNMCKRVGFEIPSEASMFALILDQINQHNYEY